ncbi:MAG: hypothetical protein IPK23_14910 [Rhizobiales bacterium]|nr:hypothetical protein [Hyphomicrobiales bacterium]
MLPAHMALQILERAIAARTDTAADAVLNSRHDAFGGRKLALDAFFAVDPRAYRVVFLRDTLLQAVTLAAQFRFLALASNKTLTVPIWAIERQFLAGGECGEIGSFGMPNEHLQL